jgi:hypothetical protein
MTVKGLMIWPGEVKILSENIAPYMSNCPEYDYSKVSVFYKTSTLMISTLRLILT